MPDYSKGKIYKIVADTDEEYKPYVGSSCQELSQRMTDHQRGYKRWKKNKGKHIRSYDLFDQFGVDKCKIILLEEYSCQNISQLLMKEREWFDKIECCNQNKPFTSKEERVKYKKIYYQEHKEHISEYYKQYRVEHKEEIVEQKKIYYDEHKEEIVEKDKLKYQKNKEHITERNKIYRDTNKEHIAEKGKEWYEANKEQICEKKKEKFECDCGSICRKSDKVRHERSQKHQNWLKSL
jgi:dsDNA-binding SOS-regulon protein